MLYPVRINFNGHSNELQSKRKNYKQLDSSVTRPFHCTVKDVYEFKSKL